jgi:hypothetical protein
VRKLRRTIPALLPHPSLLAHTIYQTLVFDGSLREDGFSLEGTSATTGGTNRRWDGLSETILGRPEWFEAWLEGEKKCEFFYLVDQTNWLDTSSFIVADGVLNDIVSSADAWQLVDDGDTAGSENSEIEMRPTVSARRVKTLIEQITSAAACSWSFSNVSD